MGKLSNSLSIENFWGKMKVEPNLKKKEKEKEKRKKKNGPCTPVELREQDLAVQLTIW